MNNFQPLEFVGRVSETQLQVSENLNKLTLQDEGLTRVEKIMGPKDKISDGKLAEGRCLTCTLIYIWKSL